MNTTQTTQPALGWTIHTIPKPASAPSIALYKSARLAGLLTNPESFGSTHAKEAAFSDDIWAARVNTQGRETLLAVLTSTTTASDEKEQGQEKAKEERTAIGTLSVLGPEMLAGSLQDPLYPPHIADEESKGELDVYMLVGMWVHPAHRDRGVGRALVRRAVEIVE